MKVEDSNVGYFAIFFIKKKEGKTQKWVGQLKVVEFYYYITSFITHAIRFLFFIFFIYVLFLI